jgi:cytochrome c
MKNCKDEVEITMRSVFLVNTPAEGGSESVMNHSSVEGLPTFSSEGPSFIPAAITKPAEETVAKAEPATQNAEETNDNAALIAAGKKAFKKCKACHKIGEGAKNASGPILTDIVGSPAGQVDGFKYSKALKEAAEDGLVWDAAALDAFLTKPKEFIKKTKMSFGGLKKENDRLAIIEYLKTNGE